MKVSKPDIRPKRKAPRSAFKPGFEPNRNMAGNKNAALQSYTVNFLNALAKKIKPEELAEIMAEDVKRHRPGAREFVADRLMGKVTQPVEQSGNIKVDGKMIIEVVHTK